jgi:hypothetical protein
MNLEALTDGELMTLKRELREDLVKCKTLTSDFTNTYSDIAEGNYIQVSGLYTLVIAEWLRRLEEN